MRGMKIEFDHYARDSFDGNRMIKNDSFRTIQPSLKVLTLWKGERIDVMRSLQ